MYRIPARVAVAGVANLRRAQPRPLSAWRPVCKAQNDERCPKKIVRGERFKRHQQDAASSTVRKPDNSKHAIGCMWTKRQDCAQFECSGEEPALSRREVPQPILQERRVTIARAYLRSRISNTSFMWGSRRMRSLDGSVSRRLSSMVEFMDSIQLASRSPSSRIHLGSSEGWLASSRM